MVRTAEHSGDNGVGVARTTKHLKKEQCQCSHGRCAHRQCRRARCLLTSEQAASPQASRCESRRGGRTFSAPAEASGLPFGQRPRACVVLPGCKARSHDDTAIAWRRRLRGLLHLHHPLRLDHSSVLRVSRADLPTLPHYQLILFHTEFFLGLLPATTQHSFPFREERDRRLSVCPALGSLHAEYGGLAL